jgi:hypothetical protein
MPWLKEPAAILDPTDVREVFLGIPQGGKEQLHVLRGIPGNSKRKALHNVRVLAEGGEDHFSTADEHKATGAHHIRPQSSLFEVLFSASGRLLRGADRRERGMPEREPKPRAP